MEQSTSREFEIFKEAIRDENLEVQIEMTKRLGTLAKHLGEEVTRKELLPFIKENIDCHDIILLNLSEQLKQFIPLVGGYQHSQPILDLLTKLCKVDEPIVRNKTVETLKNIAENLDGNLTENLIIPVIEKLTSEDWFTSKSSASALYPAIYSKVPDEKKTDLRNSFRTLIQDESPIVRKDASLHLIELIPLLEKEHVLSEFIPVFDNIAKDPMDSVRVFAVDISVALAKRLTEAEIEEFLIVMIENWASDFSWRIRQNLAQNITEMQKVIPYNKFRGKMLAIFQKLIKDIEPEVKVVAVRNIFSFCENFRKTYAGQPAIEQNFEPVFLQSILPHLRALAIDLNDEVRLALSFNILPMSGLVTQVSCISHILPLIVEIFENESSMAIQENMLQNLNLLPSTIDLTQSLHSIKNVVRSLIINSQSHWRTRRSLLVAFMHMAKFAKKEYFSENLKIYYAALLGDPIFAVRRTAALILPLLAKQYGMEWTCQHVIPFFTMFTTDCRYLYKYVPLFGIKELIKPSLNTNGNKKYLSDIIALMKSPDKDVQMRATRALRRISIIAEKLKKKLEEQTCKDILSLNKSIDDFKSDRISLYADETADILKNCCNCDVFALDEETITKEDCTYLEGLLTLIYRDFLKIILDLFDDKIVNVQIRSIHTLNEIKKFLAKLLEELKENFIEDKMATLSKGELEFIDEQVNLELSQEIVNDEEGVVNTELMESTDVNKIKTDVIEINVILANTLNTSNAENLEDTNEEDEKQPKKGLEITIEEAEPAKSNTHESKNEQNMEHSKVENEEVDNACKKEDDAF